MAAAIIEGRVLATASRSGVKDGTPWNINTARVLVAETDVSEVQYDPAEAPLRRDDTVRIVCTVSTYRGEPSFRAVSGGVEVYDTPPPRGA